MALPPGHFLRMVAAWALASGLTGCGHRQVPDDQRARTAADDVAWVCAQHEQTTNLTGHFTFEDVQRTVCYVGKFADHGLDFPLLAAFATSYSGDCDGGRGFRLVRDSPPAQNVRQLFERLKLATSSDGDHRSCMARPMIEGMVHALEDDNFHFQRFDDPGRRYWSRDWAHPALLADSVAYVSFVNLTRGRKVVEDTLRAARRDHAIVGLILDLRGAGSTNEEAAEEDLVQLLSLFIDTGTVFEEQSLADGTVTRRAAIRGAPVETLPIVVLVNENTRAGAEAFAGALRAGGRALVMGRRTAGKGAFQTMFELPSGSRLFVPTGDLFEPGVGKISGRGVTPDLATSSTLDYPNPQPAITLAARLIATAPTKDRAGLLAAAAAVRPSLGPPTPLPPHFAHGSLDALLDDATSSHHKARPPSREDTPECRPLNNDLLHTVLKAPCERDEECTVVSGLGNCAAVPAGSPLVTRENREALQRCSDKSAPRWCAAAQAFCMDNMCRILKPETAD